MAFGKTAVEQIIEYVRTLPQATAMFPGYVPGDQGKQGFYSSLGFLDTVAEQEGAMEMSLVL